MICNNKSVLTNIFMLLGMISISYSQIGNKTVNLKGNIKNNGQDTLYLENYSYGSLSFDQQVLPIPLNNKKNFNISFQVDKPAYYRIGRNFMYLSPGDSLVVMLDSDSRKDSYYSGNGAEANNYLTHLLYPKAGSFWGENEIVSGIDSYKEVPSIFKKAQENRLKTLSTLENVSEQFRTLEAERLRFEYVNSLRSIFYLYYNKVAKNEMTQSEMDSIVIEADNYFIPFIKQELGDYNSTSNLQLEVFQSLLFSLNDEEFRKKYDLKPLNHNLREYMLVEELLYAFSNKGYTLEFQTLYKNTIDKITNKKYLEVLNESLENYKKLSRGEEASNITLTKLKGGSVDLDDFKGNVIVVDLWATWCGPCMKEKPYFENLQSKYKGQNIKFLSISIDKIEVWRSYFKDKPFVGEQFHIDRRKLSNYIVTGIPRFFVIDEKFKIVDVFAPNPSSGKLEELINEIR